MFTSGRCLFVLVWILSTSLSFAKIWPASKFEIPPLADSFYSMGMARQQELNPESVKVLVWNMLKGERSSWHNDFLAMGGDKDILMLQEAYLNPKMTETLNEMSEMEFFMGVSFLYKKKNRVHTGTLLGTKVQPVDSYMMRSTVVEPFILTPKTQTAGVFPFYGKKKHLLVLNIHGINFANHKAFVSHVAQAVEKIKQHDGPVIYAGDFNTRTRKRLAHLRQVLNAQGLTEIVWKNDRRKRWMGTPLDQAYIRDMVVKNAEVLGNIKSSDHKPLELQLSYQGE